MLYSDQLGLPKPDPKRWRLVTNKLGQEFWEYEENPNIEVEQQPIVKHLLKSNSIISHLPNDRFDYSSDINSTEESLQRGATFLTSILQDENSGTFPCQYKGPMFMTIGYIVSMYVAKIEIPEHTKQELIRYIVNTAHPVDGGWGLHSVDKSTCLGTSINYVCLRLLGMDKNHEVCVRSRKKLHQLGGAIGAPHWGKIYLALLNLYSWDGVNPAPPELWLLPSWVPVHPGNWWVHTRAIYLAVGHLSALEYQCDLDPLLEQIRDEIYVKPFDKINFSQNRNTVCGVDLYYPHSKLLNLANDILVFYGKHLRTKKILKWANDYSYSILKKELINTSNMSIAPVSFAFTCIVTMIEEGKDSEIFKNLIDNFKYYLFNGPQGMCVMGTDGVQVWDCAFFVQYFFMTGLAEQKEYIPFVKNAYEFLCRSQFDSECEPGSFRDKRKGGWPFSTKPQGYTVSDCTAEAMKAIIMVKNCPLYKDVHHLMEDSRLHDSVDILLSLQNIKSFEYGSFSTYEQIKAPLALEALNPAEVFGNIMVEYPYVECTDSSVLGLAYFRDHHDYKKDLINKRIDLALNYIKKVQKEDGSWYGCWGVCFTYAGMFALEALYTVGETYENSDVVKRGCDFLVSKQREDGGWSESMKSSELHSYVESEKSLVVQSAWALIGLILAKYPNKDIIKKGCDFITSRQNQDGSWDFEDIEGVFNHSCAIEYPSYRYLFTLKALGLYKKYYVS
ncbi:terpene synthase [Hanseniaspora valbyensis NRRL Y-1626]|uniref:Terpene cyclase/mutase family member n=1 Tax=Hanseniaspora valbyensis NRRL Y-1626 TaxID=766949 RepID=A0A1B7TD15_9ASCO|nr:terpene synthase [Hanseniaspora valbyensis NRRL Y-1626]